MLSSLFNFTTFTPSSPLIRARAPYYSPTPLLYTFLKCFTT